MNNFVTETDAYVFFAIPGTAHGKGRPRFTKSGHAYTDSKTASFEGVVRRMASDAMKASGHEMAQGQAVRVEMVVEVPCPVSYSAKKRKAALAGELPPFKPDVDNIAKSILDAMNGIEHPSGNLFFVNLRGHAQPLDKLAPIIIRMAKQVGAGAIIIDSIYKIITGDENNASDMGKFCNLFDQIAQETGAAVIYSHHHAKGLQGMKKAIDRGSGSGVFARDPDAIIDISQLDLDDREIPMDSTIGDTDPAFQISGCLREFRAFKPFNVWFRYPLFVPDEKHELDSAFIQGDPKAHLKQYADPRVTADQVLEEIQRMDADGNGLDRVKACIELQARFKRGDKTIRNLIKELQKQGRIATMAGKLVQVHPEKLNGQD